MINGVNPTDEEWEKRDNLVKLWIYGTISKALVKRVLKKNLKACDVWKNLKDVFHDNKDTRAMQLDNDVRNLSIGNLSVTQYFTKIKDMVDLLANIKAPISDKSLVTYAVNGLSNNFSHVASIIRHRDPFPTFDTARSMLLLEESILNRETSANSLGLSSSPSVIVATTKGNSQELCRNFILGSCRFGNRCRFVHGNKPTGDGTKTRSHANSNTKSLNRNTGNHGKYGNMVRMIQTQPATDCLWSPRLQTWVKPTNVPPLGASGSAGILGPIPHATGQTTPSAQPNFTSAAAFGPTGPPVPTGFCYAPSGPRVEYGPEVMYTTLPQAFSTMTLQEGRDAGWYMDTGATSHLASDKVLFNPS
nr:hypothetical protein [Tanacetum cinerariifolium]